MAFDTAVLELGDPPARTAASAELSRSGARSASYESLSSGGASSGRTGWTSRYLIDSAQSRVFSCVDFHS